MNELRINQNIFHENYWKSKDRNQGILIASESFPRILKYVVKGDSLILLSGANGIFCFDLSVAELLTAEIREIVKVYLG